MTLCSSSSSRYLGYISAISRLYLGDISAPRLRAGKPPRARTLTRGGLGECLGHISQAGRYLQLSRAGHRLALHVAISRDDDGRMLLRVRGLKARHHKFKIIIQCMRSRPDVGAISLLGVISA